MNCRPKNARPALILAAALLFFSFAALAQKKQPPAHPVDLNSASAAELQQIPGIGPSTAKAIVNFREKSGPFERVEDLLGFTEFRKTRSRVSGLM